MNDYIELQGADGVPLRFRLNTRLEELPAMAGNFVCVRDKGGELEVICAGAANSLQSAAKAWKGARDKGAEALYVRLNVAGATRAQELDSLVERYKPAQVISEGPSA
ncbi:MAG: hypothetical protein Q7T61_12750 [Caulobacter sp.]|nr:hypothetical protein [Caulobacter sp.]